jgi:hypothetical protein
MLRKLLHKRFGSPGRAKRPDRRKIRLFLEPLEDRFVPATLKWNGAAGANWSPAASWLNSNNQGQAPVNGDTLVFDGTKLTDSNDNMANLKIATLTIAAAYTKTITISNTLIVGQDANGGQSATTSTMAGGAIAGLQFKDFELFNGATLNWSGGSWTGPQGQQAPYLKVDPSATLNIQTAASIMNRTLNVLGTVSDAANNDVQLGGGLVVASGGTFDITVDKGLTNGQAQEAIYNEGLFRKSAGTGTSTIALSFTNDATTATLKVQTGILSFTSTASQSAGTTNIFNNTTLATTGTFTVSGGSLYGAGTSTIRGNLSISAGDFFVGGDGTIGTFNVTNNYTQTGGTLHIDIDAKAGTTDVLNVTNAANLGGTLLVNSLTGKPAAAVTIITDGSRVGDFATKTYLGGVNYTPDLTDNTKYKLVPN